MNARLLRAALAEHGMTQGKLAYSIGISENSMSRKIQGRREFTISEADRICEILKIADPAKIFLTRSSQKCNNEKE
ncbi:helix-turn-helix transcriptional regulator [Pseudoflavonifractor phocaeensis]|uniref:helix-turn-helix transcriptional regulator n=1 Tax=Pseudoflavonifractor phocaeensis TaxID=1870988 RepID=UPI00313C6883